MTSALELIDSVIQSESETSVAEDETQGDARDLVVGLLQGNPAAMLALLELKDAGGLSWEKCYHLTQFFASKTMPATRAESNSLM
jgi:hypothetical protein